MWRLSETKWAVLPSAVKFEKAQKVLNFLNLSGSIIHFSGPKTKILKAENLVFWDV